MSFTVTRSQQVTTGNLDARQLASDFLNALEMLGHPRAENLRAEWMVLRDAADTPETRLRTYRFVHGELYAALNECSGDGVQFGPIFNTFGKPVDFGFRRLQG